MSEHQRFDLDEAAAGGRAPIDASWSKARKRGVAIGAVSLAALALSGGAWFAMAQQPPRLPQSAAEALEVMGSDRFDRLDDERKRQYASEARRLIRELPEEERRDAWDEESEEARRAMREAWLDDMARRRARGEEIEWPPRDMPRPDRRRWQEMSDEERQEMRRQMLAEIRARMAEAVESGNGQSSALRMELMTSGRGRGGPGGGGRRGR